MELDQIQVNGRSYPIKVHYERRCSIRAYIGKSINVRIPKHYGKNKRLIELEKIKLWIKKQLIKKPELMTEKQIDYQDGQILDVGNKKFKIWIDYKDQKTSTSKTYGNIIHLCISTQITEKTQKKQISTLISRSCAKIRSYELKEKIHKLNEKYFQKKIKEIYFKYNKTNWGSCSSDGNINISTRLLFAPDEVLEYVCIHELAHLIEMNHSKRFWKIVETIDPNYKEKEKWLKENRKNCLF